MFYLIYLLSDYLELSQVQFKAFWLIVFYIVKTLDGIMKNIWDSSLKLLLFIYTKKNATVVDTFIELVSKKQIEFF
jgi:hypothetical protein